MASYILYSYFSASIAYGLLLVLAIFQKRRCIPLILAAGLSLLWTASIVASMQHPDYDFGNTLYLETLRDTAWLVLLSILLSRERDGSYFGLLLHARTSHAIGLFICLVLLQELYPPLRDLVQHVFKTPPLLFAHLLLAVLGLILIEQLYRNTPLKQRWHIKFLCIGLAALFVVDLIVYSKSLLFVQLDFTLWQSRGFINALSVPLLAISCNRLDLYRQRPPHLSAPRKVIFHTTFLLGCCLYLFLMSLVGFYIKNSNAIWGEAAQTLFIFLAILVLAVTFTSGKIRALVKISLSKHFFHYSYDYREEWLKISRSLAKLESLSALKGFILNSLIDLVEGTGGGLWLKNRQGGFYLAEQQNLGLNSRNQDLLPYITELTAYLNKKQWVIDFYEQAHAPEIYDDIELSPWSEAISRIWLIIPLLHLNNLEAFVVLTESKVPRKLDWEDHDLLKTVGMQMANALALHRASEELASNQQFEAYNRLSAFLVHDLKNLVAQISLIVKNAEKHKYNPQFFDDTIDTLQNVGQKMRLITENLKHGQPDPGVSNTVNLEEIVNDIGKRQAVTPSLQVEAPIQDCLVRGDSIKLTSILNNLVQNALDASNRPGGWVKLVLQTEAESAVIKIMDNGVGMSQTFIAERLFKPFDTTKGNAGMGIGAYEARDYVEKLGGEIDVHSQPERGSIFTIRLPLIKKRDHNV